MVAIRRKERIGHDEVAARTGVPARTVSRIIARTGYRAWPIFTQWARIEPLKTLRADRLPFGGELVFEVVEEPIPAHPVS